MQDMVIVTGSFESAFEFRIDGGMDERDRDEYESMDSSYVMGPNWPRIVSDSMDLHHRMVYLHRRNLGFSFIRICSEEFRRSIESVDPALVPMLAYMVADFYRNGTQCVEDLLENVSRKNPAGFENILETHPYHKLMTKYLLGLCPSLDDRERLLRNTYFEKVPADKFECASIHGDIRTGFYTKLILRIVVKA